MGQKRFKKRVSYVNNKNATLSRQNYGCLTFLQGFLQNQKLDSWILLLGKCHLRRY